MNRITLCKKIAYAIMEDDLAHSPRRSFQQELVPGKIWMCINYDNRIPDLIIIGSEERMGETLYQGIRYYRS